jgi:5-(aminomethyl)-3-furanmethanol phosphate kinase
VWVVKLGGSLAFTAELAEWLQQLAAHGPGRVVIVPGGGPFADMVRSAQDRLNFLDPVAHRMALRAMDQYGLLLCGMEPRLLPVVSAAELKRAVAEQQVPVWLPTRMLDELDSLEANWAVTADSLAAWLTAQCGYDKLLLVKSVILGSAPVAQQDLVRGEILDAAFPRYRGPATEVRCVNRMAYRWLPQLLAGTMSLGALVPES